ncbi:MAG: hypothetical protein ACI91O_000531 [Candidatus Poriferisodalaceae bacterium]|jgi:hypothetical protein
MTTSYLNLDLSITGSRDDGFFAKASTEELDSPKVPFELPFGGLELESLVYGYSELAAGTISDADRAALMDPKEFGSKLFEAVIDGRVQDVLRKSEGVNIRVRLNVDSPDLASVPWEFLYDEAHLRFLAISNETPLVRSFNLTSDASTPEQTDKIRVLVMTSNPGASKASADEIAVLDAASELSALEDELPDVEIVHVAPTLKALQDELKRVKPHIFHFIGHGGFQAEAAEGQLVLEKDSGEAHPVTAEVIAAQLLDHPSLRLVVLNACEGARSTAAPTSGVAQTLFAGGIDAVVAMQFEVSDRAALAFSRSFYASIGASDPIERAVTEGRKAAFELENEWATPVLFLRSKTGTLFNVGPAEVADPIHDAEPNEPTKPASGWTTNRRNLLIGAGGLAALILLVVVLANRSSRTDTADTSADTPSGADLPILMPELIGKASIDEAQAELVRACGDGSLFLPEPAWDPSSNAPIDSIIHQTPAAGVVLVFEEGLCHAEGNTTTITVYYSNPEYCIGPDDIVGLGWCPRQAETSFMPDLAGLTSPVQVIEALTEACGGAGHIRETGWDPARPIDDGSVLHQTPAAGTLMRNNDSCTAYKGGAGVVVYYANQEFCTEPGNDSPRDEKWCPFRRDS